MSHVEVLKSPEAFDYYFIFNVRITLKKMTTAMPLHNA